MLRQEADQVVLGDEPEVEQKALDPLAALLLQHADLAEVVGTDAAAPEEQILEGFALDRLPFHVECLT